MKKPVKMPYKYFDGVNYDKIFDLNIPAVKIDSINIKN